MFQILNINLQDYFKPYKINLHYLTKYENFIISRLNRPLQNKRINRHHILPKCLFPGLRNESENIIKLTDREHFIAHLLLTRLFYNKNKGLLFAFNLMNGTINSKLLTSRSYEVERQLAKEALSSRSKNRTEEEKRKISKKWKETWMKKSEEEKLERNKKHSETLKKKSIEFWKNSNLKKKLTWMEKSEEEIKEINKKKSIGGKIAWEEKKKDPEIMKNIKEIRKRNAIRDWATSSEEKKYLRNKRNSETQLSLPFITCPYCGKTSRSRGNMKRHHFDNCLKNPNLTNEQREAILRKKEELSKKNSLGQKNLIKKNCPFCEKEFNKKEIHKHLKRDHDIQDLCELRRIKRELFS